MDCPDAHLSQSQNLHLASRLALRKEARRVWSPASGFSLLSWLRSVTQPAPMASLMTWESVGFARSNQRRGVTPLVLLLKRSGKISARSFTVVFRNNSE